MKLKKHKDFLNEDYDDYFEDDMEAVEYVTYHGETLTEDTNDGHKHYTTEGSIKFGTSDVSGGEIVPALIDYFEADIYASGIGLTSLKYFPNSKVNGEVIVDDNNITNLEFCPDEITGDFSINNNKLTSLKGFPVLRDNAYLENNLLIDLKGIKGDNLDELSISDNKHLVSTEGLGVFDEIYDLFLEGCTNLKELKELPKSVNNLDISRTGITSLRSLFKKTVYGIVSDVISEFEINFYYEDLNNDSDISYDQQLVNHLITINEYDPIKDSDVYVDDYKIEDHIEFLDIDYSNITTPDKYKNIFKSYKTINKFSL